MPLTPLETHDRPSMINVDEYNTGQILPAVCCGSSVQTKRTTELVRNTNLVVSETYAHLVFWQCVHKEHHNGKTILLSNDI